MHLDIIEQRDFEHLLQKGTKKPKILNENNKIYFYCHSA